MRRRDDFFSASLRGPGKIDGKMGEFFRKTLISYKHAHAMPKTSAVDSWLKVHPNDKRRARKFLELFPVHLSDNGLGTISEVFDANKPHLAGGCIAQAWSVAEVLRSWVKTA